MTLTRVVIALTIGVAALVAGTAAAVGAAWLLAKMGRRWGTDDTPMGRTLPRFDKLSTADAEAVQARAAARHARAEAHHVEGRQIAAGDPPPDSKIIKLVSRR